MRLKSKILLIFIATFVTASIAGFTIEYSPDKAYYLVLLLAVILFYLGAKPLLYYRLMSNWQPTEGKITSISECSVLPPEDIEAEKSTRTKKFYPAMEYTYTVNGKSYAGTMVSLEKENIWSSDIEHRWWLSLNEGDEIIVYVNPNNKSKSVMITEVSSARFQHHLSTLIGGLLLGVIWFYLWFV